MTHYIHLAPVMAINYYTIVAIRSFLFASSNTSQWQWDGWICSDELPSPRYVMIGFPELLVHVTLCCKFEAV